MAEGIMEHFTETHESIEVLDKSQNVDPYTRLWLEEFDETSAAQYHLKFNRPVKRYKHLIQTQVCLKWLKPGICVDAPIGSGRITRELAIRKDIEVIGFDLSPGFLSYVEKTLGVRTVRGDLLDIPFPSDSVDNVVCLHTLHGIRNFQSIIREFMRILKPGGILITDIVSKEHVRLRRLAGVKPYPYATPMTRAEINQMVQDMGGVVKKHYSHDWADSAFVSPLSRSRLGRTGLKLITPIGTRLEVAVNAVLPQAICPKHLIVVEKKGHPHLQVRI